MSDGGFEEDSGEVSMTQGSALAGISHGVETQVLKNMFDSLPPSSQVVGSEMLGSSAFTVRVGSDLIGSTDLETQQQSRPREESVESFTADESMKVDPAVPDRGLKCCCEVDVCFLLSFRLDLTGIPARGCRFLLVQSLRVLVSHVVRVSEVPLNCRPCPYNILLGVWGS